MSDAAAAPSMFGKLASRGDFVRIEMADEAGRALESWLTGAVERSQGEVPSLPVRFLFSHQGTSLLGAWVKSRDEIGRTFPLAAFSRVSEEITALRWSLLPAFFDAYLTSLESALGSQLDQLPEAALEAVREVPMPHPSELVAAIYGAQAQLGAESCSAFGRRVFGELALPMPYAVLTLREACARPQARPTLDLPVKNPHDTFVWLELLAALANDDTQQTPAIVWSAFDGRALVTFDAPSQLTCAFLLDPRHGSNERWPVCTSRVDAQQALDQLPPAIRSALINDVNLLELAASLRGAR